MFSELDYRAAAVHDAARWLNDAIDRAMKNGLTVSLKIVEGQPVSVVVVNVDRP
jgi:hypothetical protein